jgi:hypothetical protein
MLGTVIVAMTLVQEAQLRVNNPISYASKRLGIHGISNWGLIGQIDPYRHSAAAPLRLRVEVCLGREKASHHNVTGWI